MNYWVTSDTHFGHHMMVKKGYRKKGFEEEIISQLAHYVKPNDVLIHLCDVCFYKHELYNTLISKVCTSWLIKGNHDRKTYSWYLRHGWDCVADELEMNLFGKRIVLSHRPVIIGDDKINVHGHLHNPEVSHRLKEVKGILTSNHVLVSIEGPQKVFKLKKLVGM